MKSIKTICKIGYGPSSSHTMGPSYAAEDFLNTYTNADHIRVILFGSLAKTGKGHGTDRAVSETLASVSHEIIFDYQTETDVPPPTHWSSSPFGRMRIYLKDAQFYSFCFA